MYFVEAGTLVVLKQIEGEEKKVLWLFVLFFFTKTSTQVNEIQQGGYFGELGLINHAPRQATVSAREDVKVACKKILIILLFYILLNVIFLVLDALAFERLLGPCMEVLMRDTENYKEMLVRAFGSKVKNIHFKQGRFMNYLQLFRPRLRTSAIKYVKQAFEEKNIFKTCQLMSNDLCICVL